MTETHRKYWLLFLVVIITLAALILGPLHDAGLVLQKKPDFTQDHVESNSAQKVMPAMQAMPAMHAALQGFERDTGASNAVAAVYLQYRLYDTLFEALLLLISVLGILYFLEEKSRDKRENSK